MILLLVTILLITQADSSSLERRQTIERVRNYLREYDNKTTFVVNSILGTPLLENSDKIGSGYDLLSGTSVCYRDSCQIEGFRRSSLN
jgi:hypothetical protein